jgi:ABC-type transporter Mla maintaining outer membrane lipid asymmetry ATPase subunit MlaF
MIHASQIIPGIMPKKKQDSVVLGKVSGSLWRNEELTEGQLNHHVHIVGASGYGKTVLLSHIIQQRIAQGKGLLFIDLKGDMETILKLTGSPKSRQFTT